MFPFVSFGDWINQAIHIILFKFFSWYNFIFTPTATCTTTHSEIPNEIITDILLRLPPKSIVKCMSVSKAWHQLISSPNFVNTHLKLNKNHRVLFPGINGNFNFSSLLPSLFDKQQATVHMDSPALSSSVVGSANGLICLYDYKGEIYIWNPTISKSKKLLNMPWDLSFYMKYGFGFDESCDDYKALFVDDCVDESDLSYVVNIYSLRTDSWKTLYGQLKSVFLINLQAKFVNGKLYWTASTSFCDFNVRKIISFDVAEETWDSLELPICGEANFNIKLGVVGSELSLIYTANLVATTSDVWILKNSGLHVSWTKQFTIEYPENVGIHIGSPTTYPFSTHLRHSTKGDILLSLPGVILIFGGSTGKLEHTVDVVGCDPAEIYAESIVNPLRFMEVEADSVLAAECMDRNEEALP